MSIPPDPRAAGGVHKHVSFADQVVHGDLNINVGATEGGQSLQTPPRNLPPRQFATFAGRERELRDLHACFAHEAVVGVTQQAAVHSHGGVGKTSLAIEYGWRHLEDYPGGVFFLSCERAPVPPLAELAPYLGIRADGNAEETDALVKARLEAGAASLLILDNVEGPAQWLGGQWNRLLPQSPCRRLVTTRASLIAGVRMIPLERLSAEDGLQLLANFREDALQESDAAAAIVEWFDGLAVGLTVVGVYMQMNPLLSWKAYAEDLEGRGLVTVRETEAEIGEAMEYEGRAGSVFNDVLQALPAAERRALEYAALLPEDNVYAPWLVELLGADGVEVRPRPGYTDAPARQVVDALVSRQLLRPRGEDRRVLGLHRVLRRHLAEQLSGEDRSALLDRISELAIRRGKTSRTAVTDVKVRGELTPLTALAQALDESGRTAAAVSLTNWVVPSLREMGRYPEARALVERFVSSSRQEAAGAKGTATLLANLALTLRNQGELSESRRRMEQAIAIRERLFSTPHPALAISASNLGLILKSEGKFPEARRRIEQAIAINEQLFPPDHPLLATNYSNLATILKNQGELLEARRLMDQAITIQERYFPPDHPSLATSYSNLAIILHDEGDLPEARRRIEQAITINERHFPLDHPTLAIRYSNLGLILREQGELPEARRRMEQAIAIQEQHFPSDHPTLAVRYSNLALILTDQGELREARRNMEQAIAIQERRFPPDHPALAASYNNLGNIERASGDKVAACTLYHRADAILRKHFPPEHPHRLISSRKLAEFRGDEP